MKLTESIRIALRALLSNKLRAVLTMLGIIIGVGAVITLMSVGKGVEKMVQDSFEGMGSDLLFVLPGSLDSGESVKIPELTMKDYQAIADPFLVPDTVAVLPELLANGVVSAGKRNIVTEIDGVTPGYPSLRRLTVAYGSFFSKVDVNARSRVAVLGNLAYERLFDTDVYPIGQIVRINGVPFRVVGVLAEKGGSAFGSSDNIIYVPLSTAHARLYPQLRNRQGESLLSIINVKIADESLVDPVAADITELLRSRHRIAFRDNDDFTVVKQTDILSVAEGVTGALTIFLGAIAGVSLLVGGIGIMNIMLVSVTERTREIGIRKAVGAKRRDIRAQFLVEAMVLAFIGGIIGIVLGVTSSQVIASLAEDLETIVNWDTILLATGFSAAVGLFFGIYPSNRAAGLNPIDALRHE
jgi:putative ABC transport system permease protein